MVVVNRAPPYPAVIRPLQDAQADAVAALWHATNLESYPYNAVQQSHTLEGAVQFFCGTLRREARLWVATVDDTPAGVLALQGDLVRTLAVFRPWQRRGIGTALMATARAESPRGLRLYTFERNAAARAFYARLGFVEVAFGVSPAPESEPDVLLQWAPSH